MSVRMVLLRETLVSIVINVAITIALFFVVFGLGAPISGTSFGLDCLAQAFFVALMGTAIPGLLVRHGSGSAIAPLILRSLALALASFILAGGGAWSFFSHIGSIGAGQALTIKVAFAAILCTILTPFAVYRALTAPVREFK